MTTLDQIYINKLKTDVMKPCVYLDNGGLRRMSATKFNSAEEAKAYFPSFCYWPETNPFFYENGD